MGRRGLLLVSLALTAACSGVDLSAPRGTSKAPPGAVAGTKQDACGATAAALFSARAPAPAATEGAVLDDAIALAWLDRECRSCHGVRSSGVLEMTWPMPATLTREWLEVTESSAVAYELLRRRAERTGEDRFPPPMPPTLDDAERPNLEAVVAWFGARFPLAVAIADVRAGRKPAGAPPAVPFSCVAPASSRTFLTRVTRAALGREPSAAELAGVGGELDGAVTPEERKAIVSRLGCEWKGELEASGLRTLAKTIAQAGTLPYPGMTPVDGTKEPLDPVIATDVDEELAQLVVAHGDDWDYASYFTRNVVMVSPRTAPLYGCDASGGWQECTLKAPRSGFFTTFGYLNLSPQTFLSGTNDSRRFSGMYQTLFGEGPPRSPTVGATPPALPDCIETVDTRQKGPSGIGGGYGVASILHAGQVCQSCHLGRGVAAGMILFRPFSTNGSVYDAGKLGDSGPVAMPDADAFIAALDPAWTYFDQEGTSRPVDVPYLQTLLSTPVKACLAVGDPSSALVPVSSVGELAGRLIAGNPGALARGFARHAHRAFSKPDAPGVTSEMIARTMEASSAGKTKITDLLEAYFLSDSMACAEEY